MTLGSYTAPTPSPIRPRFAGGSAARFMARSNEVALIRPWLEQNEQKKSQRCRDVTIADTRHARAHAVKSPAAQAQHLRPFGAKKREPSVKDNGRLLHYLPS
jgi:hypothetical protein